LNTQGQPPTELPESDDILISAAASLVNLAGIRLTEAEHKNAPKAKEAIEAARQLLPLCPEDAVGPIRDALSQVQMLYVRQTQEQPAEQDAPAAPSAADAEAERIAADERERAKARSKIWIPGSE
jgi:hypothetical protein